MNRTPRRLAVLALVALVGSISAGCGSNASSETGTGRNKKATDRAGDRRQRLPRPERARRVRLRVSASPAVFRRAVDACKYGRRPARTGDLLLVRRERLLRCTAACRSGRSAGD